MIQHNIEFAGQLALNIIFREMHAVPERPLVLNTYQTLRGNWSATFSSSDFPDLMVHVHYDEKTKKTFSHLMKSISRDVEREQPTLFESAQKGY